MLMILCKKILRVLHGTCKLINKMENFLRRRTKTWVFIIMIFETNFQIITYYCFNSVSLFFCFTWINKTNQVLAVLCLFVMMIYFLVGYSLIYNYNNKSSVRLLLMTKVYQKNRNIPFIFESFVYLGNKFFKAMIHSNIVPLHSTKMLFLIPLQLLLIVFSISKKIYF